MGVAFYSVKVILFNMMIHSPTTLVGSRFSLDLICSSVSFSKSVVTRDPPFQVVARSLARSLIGVVSIHE